MKFKYSIQTGFTLIELVTVIGILALLASATIAIINPVEQFRKAQDAKRKSDLAQIQKALEVYYQDYRHYPYTCDGQISHDPECSPGSIDIKEWGKEWTPYIELLPKDPSESKNYGYWTDNDDPQSYAIYASLDRAENDKQACNPDAPTTPCQNSTGDPVISCGADAICTYGVSSPNISP